MRNELTGTREALMPVFGDEDGIGRFQAGEHGTE